ncbi:GNAT family N-acetyltransferase [Ornithinimicrobium ciconiae]|uniref:GNAT family N-acetyltransferase n=1 Tax=Ornithinimicrobium ciconiae TaxID=2594265 RepID=A0A516G6A6_9MICO|nr:GNAT family N-acetyltransferase [Ornithinimicrobium ciconiae]QDO87049.1 GNAT family N-acetyltransferase [Ornithinimicrobium ciconiae]
MSIHAVLLPVPAADAPPGEGLKQVAAVEAAHVEHVLGHADLAEAPEVYAVGYRSQETTRKHYLLARDTEGQAVGYASVRMPLKDNLSVAHVFPSWLPGSAPEKQVYDALWTECLPLIETGGRSVVHSWTMHPAVDVGHGWVEPQSGVGRLGRDDRADWLESQGFVLEQVEIASTLTVTADLITSAGEVIAAADGTAYKVRSWLGPTPPELRGEMARLRARMSIDAPSAGMEQEDEHWDEAEVVRVDRVRDEWGRDYATAVALGPDGQPVAYSELAHPRDRPQVAIQDDTLVHGDHRGHGLGLLVKAAALTELTRNVPALRRIHTWNAAENTHMLAINRRLGFVPLGVTGAWQLRRG